MREPAAPCAVVAVVEDDAELRDAILLPMLARAGFRAIGLGDALALYRAMMATNFDLVLLDAGLPDDDGFAIAAHLRSLRPTLGIVMLTGYASDQDRLRGLTAGVDAYLIKPVDGPSLVATLQNLGRRIAAPAVAPTVAPSEGWQLDQRGWQIVLPSGERVTLSLAEQQVMALLASSPGVAVPREVLIARLVEDTLDFDPHRLEMLVYRLRQKCLRETGRELPLRAVRGIGYALAW